MKNYTEKRKVLWIAWSFFKHF